MLTLFRWTLRLTIALIVLLVLATLLVWYFAMRSLPDYNADYVVPGIGAEVEIVRSTENVPHIFSESDRDTFFALGLAHAQDRLFQMTVLRRAAQGRLSEIYGERTFAADDLARRLGFARMAREAVAAQDERTQEALRAYADGVNEWIAIVNREALGRGAPEFFLVPDDIAFWQPADSLAILKLYAAATSRQLPAEILRAQLSLVAPERGQDLVAGLGEPAMPGYASLFPGGRIPGSAPAYIPEWPLNLAGYLVPFSGLSGSSLAADAERTTAGEPLMANDPQAALTLPSLWYLARLDLRSGDVIGATIPGIPAVFSGRSAQLAWGLVPAQADDTDIHIEEIQPGDVNRYRGPNGWQDFTVRKEIIQIRDAPDRAITLRETENGPLLPGAAFGLASVTPAGFAASVSWTGQASNDTTLSALIGIMSATDRRAAIEAAQGWVAPAMRITLADHDGIAQPLAGLLPQRDPQHATLGRMPTPGWIPANRWQGLAPAEAPDGTANGLSFATGALPLPQGAMPLGFDGDEILREGRLSRLLSQREVYSRDSFIDTQLDIVSPAARSLLPLIGADLWFTGEPAAPGTPERQRQDALELLAQWDGAMSEHLPEPLIYAAWLAALQDRLIRDDLGPLADRITQLQPGFIERVYRNRGGAAGWCDIRQSASVETCSTLSRQALDAAILELTERYGPDVTSWRWGDAHEAVQIHPALSPVPRLGWIASLRQSLSGGDTTLARAPLVGTGKQPFRPVLASAYRGVYDLADPDSSVFIIASGQSGHPFSRHYDDLAVRWRRGEYITMSLDPQLARAAATGTTRLIPADPGPSQERISASAD
ncbi:penicillin acylase family protein [Paracoccus aerodenitrificans]|uniref:penicillin acylase family protein n=1 Tax=Paracoccus aerodenitrificans TaxID=3017781 RepID=UPI0022F09CAB|nr:penicillin acylase family protein [Paracoccus aerodenitrificans]WBU65514.1 penicillin acylase family protein [Paracoccus aerodenitrificans]